MSKTAHKIAEIMNSGRSKDSIPDDGQRDSSGHVVCIAPRADLPASLLVGSSLNCAMTNLRSLLANGASENETRAVLDAYTRRVARIRAGASAPQDFGGVES